MDAAVEGEDVSTVAEEAARKAEELKDKANQCFKGGGSQ